MNRPRKETETYEEYKNNLKKENKELKERLKGEIAHPSYMRTYRK